MSVSVNYKSLFIVRPCRFKEIMFLGKIRLWIYDSICADANKIPYRYTPDECITVCTNWNCMLLTNRISFVGALCRMAFVQVPGLIWGACAYPITVLWPHGFFCRVSLLVYRGVLSNLGSELISGLVVGYMQAFSVNSYQDQVLHWFILVLV